MSMNLIPGEELLEGDCPYTEICDYRTLLEETNRWFESLLPPLLLGDVFCSEESSSQQLHGHQQPQINDSTDDTRPKTNLDNKAQDSNGKISKPKKRKKRQRLNIKIPKSNKATKKIPSPKKQLNNSLKSPLEVNKSKTTEDVKSYDEPESAPSKVKKGKDKINPIVTGSTKVFKENLSLQKGELVSPSKKEGPCKRKRKRTVPVRKLNSETTESGEPVDNNPKPSKLTKQEKAPSSSKTEEKTKQKRKTTVPKKQLEIGTTHKEKHDIQIKPSSTGSRRRTLYSPKSYEHSADITKIFSDYLS